MSVTLAALRKALDVLKNNHQKPLKVQSKFEAEEFTKADKARGIEHTWKVGEKYYLL